MRLKISTNEIRPNKSQTSCYKYSHEFFIFLSTLINREKNNSIILRLKSSLKETERPILLRFSIDNVLATTKENLNEWVTVKANVKEDFMKFHDLDVNELDGLAIMSDTDNSKMKAIAFYQNIYFSAK